MSPLRIKSLWSTALLTLMVAICLPASASAAAGLAKPEFNALDTLWVLIAAMLVFFMNAGFAFLEAGLVRAKNTVNVLGKNYVVFAIASIAYWLSGYGLMFGQGSAFCGLSLFTISGAENSPVDGLPILAFFFFQSTFAATACSIVSGAVAERIRYDSYMIFGAVLVACIYPIGGHWTWSSEGFLARLGFHDFAGSTVVHSVGGWAALSGVALLGPRRGKYDRQKRPLAIPAHSIPLAVLGGFVLWLGWFGFNPGSELGITANVPRIAMTTNLAAVFGMATATGVAWLKLGKPDITMTINGTLAGLVAITAPCASVSLAGAAVIGAIAGVVAVLSVLAFDRIGIDDPVGALSVHLVNGVWGTLAVGLFAVPGLADGVCGLFYGGGWVQLGRQAAGVAAYGAWSCGLSFVLWLLLKKTTGIRVDPEEEYSGLDHGEMGMEAYGTDPARPG